MQHESDVMTSAHIRQSGLNARWRSIIEKVDFAFQPIVNIYTGVTYGFEALLSRWDETGKCSNCHLQINIHKFVTRIVAGRNIFLESHRQEQHKITCGIMV